MEVVNPTLTIDHLSPELLQLGPQPLQLSIGPPLVVLRLLMGGAPPGQLRTAAL